MQHSQQNQPRLVRVAMRLVSLDAAALVEVGCDWFRSAARGLRPQYLL